MITYRPGVKMNERLVAVVEQIAPFARDISLIITSGVRDPQNQLSIIGKYAEIKGVRFKEFETGNLLDKVEIPEHGLVYRWQQTWSRLLRMGIIVNPPLAAKCLEDYKHPSKGYVSAGTLIQGSPHTRGTAFDVSGANNMGMIVGILTTAKAGGADIKDFLIERENNCVHVDINP